MHMHGTLRMAGWLRVAPAQRLLHGRLDAKKPRLIPGHPTLLDRSFAVFSPSPEVRRGSFEFGSYEREAASIMIRQIRAFGARVLGPNWLRGGFLAGLWRFLAKFKFKWAFGGRVSVAMVFRRFLSGF